MKKTNLIIAVSFIFLISCNKQQNSIAIIKNFVCEKKTDSFSFPSDLELLIEKKYICNYTLPFVKNDKRLFLKKMVVAFSDKNYMLIFCNRKTRILYDKTENLLIAFKAAEIDNFYFNKPGYESLYPLTFYVLNERYYPKYHFTGNTISVFKDNVKMKKFEEFKVVMENKSLNINYELFNYSDLIKVVKELDKQNYKVKENISSDILNYFYKEEPVWIEY